MNIEKMFTTIDTHVAGEAFRIVIHSPIDLKESDIKLNDAILHDHFQRERDFLLNEPRGHRGMNGCIILPSKVADYGLLFFNHTSSGTFNYGALVASVTALLETGNIAKKENEAYTIETVHGIYRVKVKQENQEVTSVSFEAEACQVIEKTPEFTLMQVDASRNYAIFSLPEIVEKISLDYLSDIQKWGKEVSEKLKGEAIPFEGIVMVDASGLSANTVRSVTFEKDGTILRSPGADSTLAIFGAFLSIDHVLEQLTNYSIFDSELTAQFVPRSKHLMSMETEGFVTGMHQFIYDHTDPLQEGFLLK
ncbi:proline racemase family protein [Virgibacillus alimentarius]|uniref:proline racemase family protein n=1 Tax=Virgibacillus alimentarius TaxID=698769 RepID=UPI0004937999|nr:proline racemase family protein [Virgibacillus alimentarius]